MATGGVQQSIAHSPTENRYVIDNSVGGDSFNANDKTSRDWLHPDQQILEEGICYRVRYIGCLEVNTSMKMLDFEERSRIAKECINVVCVAAGLKTADKKRRVDRAISRMLGKVPNMDHAGDNVTLAITANCLAIVAMETARTIAKHDMPNISFASGGDTDTLDFVAYVAKTDEDSRNCYVLECGGGLAQNVIQTIGQAFDLRFRQYSAGTSMSSLTAANGHTSQKGFESAVPQASEYNFADGDDPEYYNDLPGKLPPENQFAQAPVAAKRLGAAAMSKERNLIDLSSEPNSPNPLLLASHLSGSRAYVNDIAGTFQFNDGNSKTPSDVFDMQPFESSLPVLQSKVPNSKQAINGRAAGNALPEEPWFHGNLSRKDATALLRRNGDFLVRQSGAQFVLSGMQEGINRHLLLIDNNGVVRTKDRTFETVSHLVRYHLENGLPIISAESTLVLINPIKRK